MKSNSLDHFHHIFIDNKASQTLFLLHGTGGDENDLLPLVAGLKDTYNFVGLKGNVDEDGLTRFFRRDESGVFDQESIKTETQKLAEFVEAFCEEREIEIKNISFLGYSNGANMILATLFYFPKIVSKAVTLHPMLPFPPPHISLKGKEIFVSYGERDRMISATEGKKVISTLREQGASVQVFHHDGGHEITKEEVLGLQGFLRGDI